MGLLDPIPNPRFAPKVVYHDKGKDGVHFMNTIDSICNFCYNRGCGYCKEDQPEP